MRRVISLSLPDLTREDYQNLQGLRAFNPVAFYTDYTQTFLKNMDKGIRNSELQRISIMGKPRTGKSEVASTLAFFYVKRFNKALEDGCFKEIDVISGNDVKLEPLRFETENVFGSQADYIDELKRRFNQKELRFGQVWQIDESRDSPGGLGSFSDTIDLKNIVNIVPKFMQSELWLTPPKLDRRNCYWGINVYKKDIKNKVNYCLLYEVLYNPKGIEDYVFRGWLRIPLHKYDGFRKEYNLKKNEWIKQELAGFKSRRDQRRIKASEVLVEDPDYRAEMFGTGDVKGGYRINKVQQMAILKKIMLEDRWKLGTFNELEIIHIVEYARRLYSLELAKKEMGR